jgi:hypothetical protein
VVFVRGPAGQTKAPGLAQEVGHQRPDAGGGPVGEIRRVAEEVFAVGDQSTEGVHVAGA